MAKTKQSKQPERREQSALERLGMRVSAMINAPLAQKNRRVTIHRLDTDSDEAWDAVMELLGEEDGIDMTFNDDDTVTLKWHLESDGDHQTGEGEVQALEDSKAEEVPF